MVWSVGMWCVVSFGLCCALRHVKWCSGVSCALVYFMADDLGCVVGDGVGMICLCVWV